MRNKLIAGFITVVAIAAAVFFFNPAHVYAFTTTQPGFYLVQVNTNGSKIVTAYTVDDVNTSFDPNNYVPDTPPAQPLRGFETLSSCNPQAQMCTNPNVTIVPSGTGVTFQ